MQVSLRAVIAQFKSYSLLDNMSKTEFLVFHLSKWVSMLTHLLKLEPHPFPWVSYGVHYPFLSVFPPTYISSLSTSLPFHCHHPGPSHPHRSFAMSSNAFPQHLVPPPSASVVIAVYSPAPSHMSSGPGLLERWVNLSDTIFSATGDEAGDEVVNSIYYAQQEYSFSRSGVWILTKSPQIYFEG